MDRFGHRDSFTGKRSRRFSIRSADFQEESEIIAKAMLNMHGDNLLTGNCKVVGTPELEIGQMVQLMGVGNRFSGNYYVTKVVNEVSSSGYLTTFSVRTNVVK